MKPNESKTAERKIIQIAFNIDGGGGSINSTLCALCDDGTIFHLRRTLRMAGEWRQWELPPIPQPKAEG